MTDDACIDRRLEEHVRTTVERLLARHVIDMDVVKGHSHSSNRFVTYAIHRPETGRPRLEMARPKHRMELSSNAHLSKAIPVGRTALQRIDAMISWMFDPYVKLTLRDRQLDRAGFHHGSSFLEDVAPAWAYCASPILIASLDDEELTRDEMAKTAVSDRRAMVTDRKSSRHNLFMNGARIFRHRIDLSDLISYQETKQHPFIWVNHQIPETALAGMKGMDLSEVISHRWISSPAMITRVRKDCVVELTIDMQDEALAPIPDGLGTSWHLAKALQ